jgi:5-enolpyruvylshikimate-3-phosphate synthase
VNAESQRDQALEILGSKLPELSKLFKECYLSSGKGAVMIYASEVISRNGPKKHHYRTCEEMLEIFDAPESQEKLKNMINNYNKGKEGIMAIITDYSNATYFITVKF